MTDFRPGDDRGVSIVTVHRGLSPSAVGGQAHFSALGVHAKEHPASRKMSQSPATCERLVSIIVDSALPTTIARGLLRGTTSATKFGGKTIGPLGRQMRNDFPRSPGRCPGLGERLGLRPENRGPTLGTKTAFWPASDFICFSPSLPQAYPRFGPAEYNCCARQALPCPVTGPAQGVPTLP